MKYKALILTIALLGMGLLSKAQCAMCEATVNSSLDSGSTAAATLNQGILYLLVMPIIFLGVIYMLYRRRQYLFGEN